MKNNKPVVLLILDGWGWRKEKQANAIALAKTPNWDNLIQNHPHMLLSASGEDVGLPAGQMGNSEVGHLCMGSGRVIYQDLNRINHDIEEGRFNQNPVLTRAFLDAQKSGAKIHLLGLVSPGGVHSHEDHFLATLNLAKQYQLKNLYVHAFLDGRDTPPQSAQASLEKFDQWFETYPHGRIATLCGRYYAMDRDKRFDRTQKAYDLLTLGETPYHAQTAVQGLLAAYERGETDEFVQPTAIGDKVCIENGDIVIFVNFRTDRARQLTNAFVQELFTDFALKKRPNLAHFITFTQYDARVPTEVVFPPETYPNVLGQILQEHHLTQLRLAETEKYAHVTFFFNGGIETPFKGEERVLIPSPKVATYDLKPEMSAFEVTDVLVKTITEGKYDVIICNYANADMVGHTGKLDAAITAIEVLDTCLGKVCEAIKQAEGSLLITADHGNAELMQDPQTLAPHTAHTTDLVPFVYFGEKSCTFKKEQGRLADVAPTLLALMGLAIPSDMTGDNVLTC